MAQQRVQAGKKSRVFSRPPAVCGFQLEPFQINGFIADRPLHGCASELTWPNGTTAVEHHLALPVFSARFLELLKKIGLLNRSHRTVEHLSSSSATFREASLMAGLRESSARQ
jgi:hypothetical protein